MGATTVLVRCRHRRFDECLWRRSIGLCPYPAAAAVVIVFVNVVIAVLVGIVVIVISEFIVVIVAVVACVVKDEGFGVWGKLR